MASGLISLERLVSPCFCSNIVVKTLAFFADFYCIISIFVPVINCSFLLANLTLLPDSLIRAKNCFVPNRSSIF